MPPHPDEARAAHLRTLAKKRRGKRPPNYGKRYPPEILRPAEVNALLSGAANTPAGLRNQALVVLMWRTGLRVEEAVSLYPKDVDLELGTVMVLHGKRDRWRMLGIDRPALDLLEAWLEVRAELGVDDSKHLFCKTVAGHVGGPIRTAYVRDAVKRMARNAGIRKRVHPHGLRHTFAFEWMNEGKPLHLLQRQLGHSSVATTDTYISHLAPMDLVQATHERSWPAVVQLPAAARAGTLDALSDARPGAPRSAAPNGTDVAQAVEAVA